MECVSVYCLSCGYPAVVKTSQSSCSHCGQSVVVSEKTIIDKLPSGDVNNVETLISKIHTAEFQGLFWDHDNKSYKGTWWLTKALHEYNRKDDLDDSLAKYDTAISELMIEENPGALRGFCYFLKNEISKHPNQDNLKKITLFLDRSINDYHLTNSTSFFGKQEPQLFKDIIIALRKIEVHYRLGEVSEELADFVNSTSQGELIKTEEVNSKYDWHWIAGAFIFIFIVTAIIYFKFIKHDDIESAEFTEELKQEEQQLQPDDSKNYVSEPKEEGNSVNKTASVPMVVEGDTIRFWTNNSGQRWRMVYIELPEHYETEFLEEPGPVEGWYVNPETGIWLNIFYSGVEIIVEHTIEGGYHTDEMLLFSTGRFNINCDMNFFEEDFNIEPYDDRSVSEKQFLTDRLEQDKYSWKKPSKGAGFGN